MGDTRHRILSDAQITLGYASFATLWIVGSDVFLGDALSADGSTIVSNIAKGLAFVLATSVLLYLALCRRSRRLDAERARADALTAELAEANRMDAIGRLAGGVAHDFNNLLMVIRGHLDLAAASAPETIAPNLRAIDQATEHAGDMTKDLLAVARREHQRPERIDLNDVLRSLDELLGVTLGEQVAVRIRPADAPVDVTVDPASLERVLLNLATNARDAMPDGGSLTLAVHRVQDHAVLSIADTGTGMDAETRAHCFEPFFTTKPKGKGTGLGLSTVYGIVHQMGGTISIDSAPGRGTTFEIDLPIAT